MRIISRFKDYYDSVSHQYLDREIIYVRDSSILEIDRKEVPEVDKFSFSVSWAEAKYYFTMEIIGFCGKLYPVVTIETEDLRLDFSKMGQPHKKTKIGFYDIESIRTFVQENKIPIKEGNKYKYRWFYSYGDTLEDLDHFLKSTKDFNKIEGFFRKYNVPVFVIRENPEQVRSIKRDLILNPMLRSYSFAKIMHPYSAHQELYQFVDSYLRKPDREMLPVSDLHKIAKHGFDKHSFRKGPTKSKGKKK